MTEKRITVIGCGLIGGSICLALKRKRPELQIVALDLPERIAAISEAGVADIVGTLDQAEKYLPQSSLVILATPVEKILELLTQIGPLLAPGTIVTDVGSTKALIVNEAKKHLPEQVSFIGGHPIAGMEHSGVEAADPLLFKGKVFMLCPSTDTPSKDLLYLIDLAEDLFAIPVTIEAEEHDRFMAMISHVPQLMAVALVDAALKDDSTHGLLDMIVGRGFLDITRIAASDFAVWKGILGSNKAAIESALDRLEGSLDELRHNLGEHGLEAMWQKVSARRRKMSLENLPRLRQPELRKLIDRYDEQLLKALGNRLRVAKKIGQLKADQRAPVHDPDRERRLIAERLKWAEALGLDPDLVKTLFESIMENSRRVQKELIGS